MSIDHSTGCPISKKYTVSQGCMSLSTYLLEYGRHVARLRRRRRRRRRRRAYAPTSNTASHDNHKKILHGFPFLSRDDYGAPLGGPSGRRSSANNTCTKLICVPTFPRSSPNSTYNKLMLLANHYNFIRNELNIEKENDDNGKTSNCRCSHWIGYPADVYKCNNV